MRTKSLPLYLLYNGSGDGSGILCLAKRGAARKVRSNSNEAAVFATPK